MKRKLLSLLLVFALAAAAVLPLTVPALAANAPRGAGSDTLIRLAKKNAAYETVYTDYYLSPSEPLNAAAGALTATVNGTTVWINMKNFNLKSEGDEYYGLLVRTPKSDWNVVVKVEDNSTLGVQYFADEKCSFALGTNAALTVYSPNDHTLHIVGGVGQHGSQEKLDRDFYGLWARSLEINSLGHAVKGRMGLDIRFNLNMTGYTSKCVYPFKVTAKKQAAALFDLDYNYSLQGNYSGANPENTPIELHYATDFRTVYSVAGSGKYYAYHSLKYADTFSGMVQIDTDRGYYYGGPYSQEVNIAALGQRRLATVGDRQYYHAVAKNCSLPLNEITPAELKKALSFPLAYGYTLPDRLSSMRFIGKVQWTVDGETEDMTGKPVAYGTKYAARVTLVPRGRNRLPEGAALATALTAAVPDNAFAILPVDHVYTSFGQDILIRYRAVLKPAMIITKQPVDCAGSNENRKAHFSVEASDPSAAYQWQISKDGSEWTNLSDAYTTTGGIKIAGAKGKNLTYDFSYFDKDTALCWFRCVVSREDGNTVTSNAAKYTYAPPATLTEIVIGGFNSQISEGDSFYDSPYVLRDGKNISWSGGESYMAEIVSHLWYEGEAGADSPAAAEGKFQKGQTYTYRIVLKNTAKSQFASSMQILKDGSGKTPDAVTKLADGRWIVDFTFGPIGQVIRRVYLYNFVPPYNGMGTMYPTVREDAGYRIEYAFTKGWHEDSDARVEIPQVGKQYYMNVWLVADEGNEFDMVAGKPSSSLMLEIRDRDGIIASPAKVEYSFLQSDGQPDPTRMRVKLTYDCTEVHVWKGGTIKDLDMPAPGQPLDTEVTRVTPQLDFQEMIYRLNGEVVDPATALPEEGDIVDILFTFKAYSDWKFDKDIYTTWWIGGNEDENAVRVYRDTSYEDEEICAFTYTVMLSAEGPVDPEKTYAVTVTGGTADKTAAKSGETVTVTANAPAEGKAFDRWAVTGGAALDDEHSATATFTMPAADVTLTAEYKDKGTPAETGLTGDVDLDGTITSGDARLALRISVSLLTDGDKTMTEQQIKLANVDGDTEVTSGDARLILRKSVGFTDPEWVG